MINKNPEYHRGKVRLVFAGQESLNGYQQLAVKFKHNAEVRTKAWSSPRRLEIDLPDRTLYITAQGKQSNVLLPFPVDALVSTRRDVNHWKTLQTDMLLFNPLHAPKSLSTKAYIRAGIEVVVDSGGFQLSQGTSDFVDPDSLADFYNRHATLGMGLDFPANAFVDERLYQQNCKLQALNNARIRKSLKPRVTLVPVIHGATPKTREHCLNTVYEQGRDPVLAVSNMILRRGDSIQGVKQRLACLALVLEKTRKHVVYYHLLGATSIFWHAVNTLLTASGYVTSIGGDSVSHRQAAIGGSYSLMPHFDKMVSWTQPVESQLPAKLPCSCPVCVISGDARVLRDFRISELHHTYVNSAIQRYIVETVQQYVAGVLTRNQLRKAILDSDSRNVWQPYEIAFRYFEDVVEKGYKKVPPLVGYDAVASKSTLFGSVPVSKHQTEMLARYAKIHKTYEKFHGKKLK